MQNVPFLLENIERRCPVLRPVYLPKGITEDLVLKRLEEKKKLPKPSNKCSICESVEGTMSLQIQCKYDLEYQTASVVGVQV